ncbi:MAG: AAA family ATPase [Candidatus Bathyarchaeia archaeon]
MTCVTVLAKIPTGCRSIDSFLEGGIPRGEVSLIYGEAETGKTTLAMQCAVNAAKLGYKTLFVDCDGTFSVKRLSQMTGKSEKIADLIILMKPSSFDEQATAVDKLEDYVSGKFGLVVIDTFTSLYRLAVSNAPSKAFELNRELNRQLASLAQTAKIRKIAVLVLSQVRTSFKEDYVSIEPVATRVVKFWANVIIEMKPTEKPQKVVAVVEKAPSKTLPQTCNLQIDETGIHDV